MAANNSKPIIIVHGGAGVHERIVEDGEHPGAIEMGVINAAKIAYELLRHGCSALDAVEAAVVELENNPRFNAGHGSCLTNKGTIEMDAAIMNGATLQSGAVALVSNIANPIKLARLIMEKTSHVMLGGEGASQFAISNGVPHVPTEALVTQHSKDRLLKTCKTLDAATLKRVENMKPRVSKYQHDDLDPMGQCAQQFVGDHDTVGAVALDVNGNLAFATSTGGMVGKMVGRIGDSPIIGSGGYADNETCAVSTTGHGESFMKMCLARQISMLVENGIPIQDAARSSLQKMKSRVLGTGGIIGIDKGGNIAIDFTTAGMSWAYIKNDELHSGIYPQDDRVDTIANE